MLLLVSKLKDRLMSIQFLLRQQLDCRKLANFCFWVEVKQKKFEEGGNNYFALLEYRRRVQISPSIDYDEEYEFSKI